MPRTRPDRTEEVRISLSNKERQFFAEQLQINRNKAWLGPLIGNIGTVTIGAGAIVGGYALWKWVGGFSPLEELNDVVKGLVLGISGGVYTKVTGESPEDTATRWMTAMQTEIDLIERGCQSRRIVPEQIIASPNSTEQQIGQAERELAQINKSCAKRIQRERDVVLNKLKYMDEISQVNPLHGLPLIGGLIRYLDR